MLWVLVLVLWIAAGDGMPHRQGCCLAPATAAAEMESISNMDVSI
jgi:hypothetical protein